MHQKNRYREFSSKPTAILDNIKPTAVTIPRHVRRTGTTLSVFFAPTFWLVKLVEA